MSLQLALGEKIDDARPSKPSFLDNHAPIPEEWAYVLGEGKGSRPISTGECTMFFEQDLYFCWFNRKRGSKW